ncbi:MAG: trigger factor [Bacilli bacterium]|nr:trigger factor [Bacilli bacterium]
MKNIHEVEVKLEGKEWKDAVDRAFSQEQKKVNVPGFRKGKVPRNVYEKKYGTVSLFYTAINNELGNMYAKVLKDNKLEPIMDPKIDVTDVDGDKLVVKFTITTKPEVKIKKYTNLGVKKETVKVTKEEIDSEIENLRARYADLVIKEGKIESGDIAVIDFEGFIGDKAFDGGKGENYSLTIGSNTFIPGFEDQLIGKKANDEVDVKVTFPKDYQAAELQGKKAVFKVKIHEVKTKELPELDEDFFLDLEMEGVKTEKDLRSVTEDQIKARKTYDAENKYIDDLLDAVEKQTTVEIPNELVEEEIDRMVHEYGHNLEHQGITLDMFYQFTNSDEQALREQMRNDAEKRVKYRFMLEEIADLEKVNVTDKQIDKEAEKLAKQYNVTKEEFLNHAGGPEALRYDLKMQKVIDIIKGEEK